MNRQYLLAGVILIIIAILAILSLSSIPDSGTSPYAIRGAINTGTELGKGEGSVKGSIAVSQPWMGGITTADFTPTSFDPTFYDTQCGTTNGNQAFFHAVVFAAKKVNGEVVFLSDPIGAIPQPSEPIPDPMVDDPLCVLGINHHLPNTDLHDGATWTHGGNTTRHTPFTDQHQLSTVSHRSTTLGHLTYSYEHDASTNSHHQNTTYHDSTSGTTTGPSYHSGPSDMHTPPSASSHGAGTGIHQTATNFTAP